MYLKAISIVNLKRTGALHAKFYHAPFDRHRSAPDQLTGPSPREPRLLGDLRPRHGDRGGRDAAGPPPATTLAAIYPNPFNPRTTIAFALAEAGAIELAIFDLRGRLVRVMESGSWPTGRHQTTWDGQDDEGRAVPTGTYVCRLATSQGSQTKKLTLAR